MDLLLTLAVIFLVIAAVLAIFGFSGRAGQMAGLAKTLLVIFVIVAVVLFLFRLI